MPTAAEQLKRAVVIARIGERSRALELFREITAQDPDCADAWLWLSELADTLEEQTASLEKAQALFPADEAGRRDLQTHLNILRGAIPLGPPAVPIMANDAAPVQGKQEPDEEQRAQDEILRQAQRLAMVGNRGEALRLLNGLVEKYAREERAWLLLSELQPDPEDKVRALEKVIEINPGNQDAARRIEALQPVLKNPLQRGTFMEERGEFDEAIHLYRSLTVHSSSATVRVEAHRRIENLRLQQEAYQVQPVNPTLNLARVTLGPVLLFGIMIFIQSGLNLYHTPILAYPGMVFVLIGSLLVSTTEMRPMHPKWVEWFGKPGTAKEIRVRRDARWIGWGMMAIPFTLFLIEAGFRLGVMQASMIGNFP